MAEVVQFLATNELSFRGDYEKLAKAESGLFVKLFRYTLLKDHKLSQILQTIPSNAKYTSPEIQNDIINELALMVKESVSKDIWSSDPGMFTLLADGTRDKSGIENVSVSVRYIKNGEAFKSLLKMPSTDNLMLNL